MKVLQNLWLALVVALFMAVPGRAQIPDTAPTYTGDVFDSLTATALDAGLFFGLIISFAVVVTGFFLGRKWLRRVG